MTGFRATVCASTVDIDTTVPQPDGVRSRADKQHNRHNNNYENYHPLRTLVL